MTNPHPFPGLWREQHLLVIERGCVFPQRCVCCDASEATPNKPLWFYQGSGFMPIDQDFGELSLCPKHQRRFHFWHSVRSALVTIMGVGGFTLLLLGSPYSFLLTLFFPYILIGRVFRLIRQKKADDEKAWFSGFPPAFLDQLPDFRERSNSRQDAGEPSGEPA